MKRLEYTVTFHTPAFLGNAEQSGQWRTPPFKTLLRQWWRVVYAKEHRFAVDVFAMRREEGLLFGHAWLEEDREDGRAVAARKSLLRLRLDQWNEGRLKSWDKLEQAAVYHPEVEKAKFQIGPHAYLGYGPLIFKRGTTLKAKAAIQAGESATLSIAIPTTHKDPKLKRLLEDNVSRLERALWLMDRYGTLGGRSRNGWGSFSLRPLPPSEGWVEGINTTPLRRWQEALALDWPHAIGQDDKGALVWQTSAFPDWRALMRELAIIKIGLRTQFVFPNKKPPHQNVEARHWLSYPITNHTTRAWSRNARLPNSLRFKVRPAPNESKRLIGVIFHMPCLPPHKLNPQQHAIKTTWTTVHGLLDELTKPSGRTYSMVTHKERRDRLVPQLRKVTLKRIAE